MTDTDKDTHIAEITKLMAAIPAAHRTQIYLRYHIPDGNIGDLSRPERLYMLEELYNRKSGTDAWQAQKEQAIVAQPAKPAKPPAVVQSYQHVPDFITRAKQDTQAQAQDNNHNHSLQGTATPIIPDRQSQSDRKVIQMDFKTELANLKAGGNFFKPSSGSTKIKFLDNGGDKYLKDFGDGKEKERIDFKVEVNGEELTWSISTGGKNSLYGQIIKLGAHLGKLEGETITLLRKGDGMETDYTVVESVSIPDESGLKQSQLKK
jgi:hypothetical protein